MLYVFGDYVLDTERRELRRAGVPVKLEPKAYQLLTYLVQHRGRLVTKAELLDQVWPDVYVADTAVARRLPAVRPAGGGSVAPGERKLVTLLYVTLSPARGGPRPRCALRASARGGDGHPAHGRAIRRRAPAPGPGPGRRPLWCPARLRGSRAAGRAGRIGAGRLVAGACGSPGPGRHGGRHPADGRPHRAGGGRDEW